MLNQNPKPKCVDLFQDQKEQKENEEWDPFGRTRPLFEPIFRLVLGRGRSTQGLWLHGSQS